MLPGERTTHDVFVTDVAADRDHAKRAFQM